MRTSRSPVVPREAGASAGAGAGGRLATALVVTLLAAVATVGATRSILGPRPAPAARLAAELRCPNCGGESVADSGSPIAAAMRGVIADQLAAGRSPDEVRAWFARRYGTGVLMDPSARAVGAPLWLVPILVLSGGLIFANRRRRPGPGVPSPARHVQPRPDRRRFGPLVWKGLAASLFVMVATVATVGVGGPVDRPRSAPERGYGESSPEGGAADPVGAALAAGGSLEREGRFDEAANLYGEALLLRSDDRLRVRVAYALLRAGRPADAADAASALLSDDPGSADGLLLLGLARRASNAPEASQTLELFLRLAPDHPAAPEVRRLLSAGAPTG